MLLYAKARGNCKRFLSGSTDRKSGQKLRGENRVKKTRRKSPGIVWRKNPEIVSGDSLEKCKSCSLKQLWVKITESHRNLRCTLKSPMYRLICIGSVVFLQGLRPYMYSLPVRHMFYSSSRNTRTSVVGYAHKKRKPASSRRTREQVLNASKAHVLPYF